MLILRYARGEVVLIWQRLDPEVRSGQCCVRAQLLGGLICLALAACSGRAGIEATPPSDPSPAPVSCVDDGSPAVISFLASASVQRESQSTFTVEMQISSPKPEGIVARLGFSGSATPGEDYHPPTAVISLPPCQRRASLSIAGINDTTVEPDEVVQVALIAADHPLARLGAPRLHSLLIEDDDGDASPRAIDLAVGGFHVCSLLSDGRVLCWGNNEDGQLGDGSYNSSATPVVAALPEPALQIDASNHNTCAVTESGALYCWGSNGYGHLGDGTYDDAPLPRRIDAGISYQHISTGYSHHGGVSTCGITATGTLKCWGDNNYGQMGDPTVWGSLLPVEIDSGVTYRVVDAGGQFGCGITTDDVLKCWGTTWEAGLGLGTNLYLQRPTEVDGGIRYREVDVAEDHLCGLTDTDTLKCWSGNYSGQLGLGDTEHREFPMTIAPDTRFASLAAGESHTCAVTLAGQLHCWGGNDDGELGTGTSLQQLWPTSVDRGVRYGAIEAKQHWVGGSSNGLTCGITTPGKVRCWGDGTNGQLQRDEPSLEVRPVALAFAISGTTGCAIGADSRLYCWGLQTSFGPDWNEAVPIRVHPQLSVGRLPSSHGRIARRNMCVISAQQRLFCWGGNASGIVDADTSTPQYTPQPILPDERFAEVALSATHACALTTSGSLYCWGANVVGQLGDAGTTPSPIPLPVDARTTYRAVVTAGTHTCALTSADELRCWGGNAVGALGDGSTTDRWVPTPVAGSHTWVAVSTASAHTCAIDSGGIAHCWGAGGTGRLGNGSTSNRTQPTPVSGGATYVSIGLSDSTSCAVTDKGEAHCWGRNIPNVTAISSNDPLLIDPGTSYIQVTGGSPSCGRTSRSEIRCWGSLGDRGDGSDHRLPGFMVALP